MLKNSDNNENNGAEGAATQPACAACKHQRKRCKRECILAPHFPADKTKEFQAVHKVFGVSNLGKLMSCVREVDRKKASESFIWEANCRLQDPALGPQGEYLKVCEELRKYKKLCEDLSRTVQLQRTTLPASVIGWNGTNGIGNGIINGNNNAFSYNNDTGNNLMVDLSSYGFHSHYVQNPDKILKQQKDVVGPTVVPYQQQQQQQQQNSVNTGYHHQQFYLPAGQYGSMNAKTMDGIIWEDQS